MVRSLFVSFAVLATANSALADLNIAPGAHLTASSWSNQAVVIEKRDAIPRNAVDGDPATVWKPDASQEGGVWLQLDFTRPWPMRYAWRRLVTRWKTPPGSYRWQVSRDGSHWHPLTGWRHSRAVTADVTVDGVGPYLRLVLPPGDPAELAEVEVYSASSGSGKLAPIDISLEKNVAALAWEGGTERNVFLYRLTRVASLGIGDGGTAGVTSTLTEGPMRHYDDRVEHPNVPGIAFEYRWTVEAFGPDGRLIDAVSTPFLDAGARSPNPFHLRGVVEGYYGPGYSDAEREDLVRFIGNRGGNFYLYGPKLDPYHRDQWREPYPAAYEASLRRLVSIAGDHGVQFAWSLSPGLDYDGSAAHKAAALAKFKTIQALGVHWFALLMDDIDVAADVTSAAAHVDLVNYLQDELQQADPDAHLLFVPTVYRGVPELLSPGQRRYLTTLAGLRPDIPVMWTGRDVFSPAIELADVQPIAALVGRPLVIWDNYPVADFFFGRRLNLGAVAGRAPDLADGADTQIVAGLLANPMWLPASNRLPLATTLDYLADPHGYAPADSLAAQVAREAPAEIADTFSAWLAAFETFAEVGLTESEATRAVSDATAALAAGRVPGADFAAHAAALYVMAPALKRLYHPDLAGELLPAAVAAAHLGEGSLLALQAAAKESTGGGDGAALRDAAGDALHRAEALNWTVTEGQDAAWLERFAKSPPRWKAPAPALTGRLPGNVEIGDEVRVRFASSDATSITLHGLPGATFEAGNLRWRPGRTGTERWVVVAANENGANVAFGEVRVVEQKAETGSGCSSAPMNALAAWLLIVWMGALKYRPTASRRS